MRDLANQVRVNRRAESSALSLLNNTRKRRPPGSGKCDIFKKMRSKKAPSAPARADTVLHLLAAGLVP